MGAWIEQNKMWLAGRYGRMYGGGGVVLRTTLYLKRCAAYLLRAYIM
jgi:hypothetical protein